MNKFLFLCPLFLFATFANGQYKAFPKLETLHNNHSYDKCIEKAEEEIKSNPAEIIPIVWQMRCYLDIDQLDVHPLKKNALSKALNCAIRIKKKDKAEQLSDDLKGDFETISQRTVSRISQLSETQYSKELSLFVRLKTIDNSLNLEYEKYLYMKNNHDADAFTTLRNLVVQHYSLFRKKTPVLENMEKAYAALMNEYYELSYPKYAKDIYLKVLEVYKNGTLCKENYLNHIAAIRANTGFTTDEITLNGYFRECLSADSILKEPAIKTTIHELKSYQVIINMRNLPAKSKKTSQSIIDYLSFYHPKETDSALTFFDYLLTINNMENLKLDNNKLYDYWINIQLELKKLKLPIEAIKSIHQYYLANKKYEQDVDFLTYCKTAYPNLKVSIAPMEAELEKLIIALISKPEYNINPVLIDKYAKKTNNKEIKDKQYTIYVTKLTDLLKANHFSGFAVNITKALNNYPGDPQLLSLKKQWVIKDYQTNYLNTEDEYSKFFVKAPDESKCFAGIVNKKGIDIVLQHINFCRRLAGSPDSCILDEALNAKCQKAALMMSANGTLNHAPPKTWKCFTPEGASAAGASNLSLGNAFHHAIMGQMEDDGAGNTACGHRRWILNPTNTVFGHGSTMNASSLYAFGTSNYALKRKLYFDEKQPLCWPSTDFFPINLIPGRWSFSLSHVDFEKAKVSVTENGKPITVYIEPLSYGYGQNTLVWVVSGEIRPDKTYKVTISNVVPDIPWGQAKDTKPAAKTFSYQVIPIQIN